MLAILAAAAVCTTWTPGERWRAGVDFSAKVLLAIAVVLFGASVSAATLLSAGPALLFGTAAVVACAIAASYAMGRLLGLPLLGVALHMSGLQFGVLASLTVYAVPQLLAAAAPFDA